MLGQHVYSHPEVIDQSRIKQLQNNKHTKVTTALQSKLPKLQMYITMALCHNCAEVRDEDVGNGVQKEYEITFNHDQDDVAVAFWDEELMV